MVGPFTLAGLMMGADEAVMSTVLDPQTLHRMCHFTTDRIQEYVQLLLAAGAEVVCILEPSAVMLSPAQFSEFSAIYIRHITTSFKYSGANFVYHTCGNTMHLVEKMARAGVQGVSIDSPDPAWTLPGLAAHAGRCRGDRQHQPDHHDAVRHGGRCPPGRRRSAGAHALLSELHPEHRV